MKSRTRLLVLFLYIKRNIFIDIIMILKITMMIFGYIMMTYGITYIIVYINLFSFGYTIKEYLIFLFTIKEGYFLPVGMLIEIIALNIRKG